LRGCGDACGAKAKDDRDGYLIAPHLGAVECAGLDQTRARLLIIEPLHHALDAGCLADEDRSRVRNPNAALVLVCLALKTASRSFRKCRPKRRAGVCVVISSNLDIETAAQRLDGLVFAKSPTSWSLQK
jgi:hypothetical protein